MKTEKIKKVSKKAIGISLSIAMVVGMCGGYQSTQVKADMVVDGYTFEHEGFGDGTYVDEVQDLTYHLKTDGTCSVFGNKNYMRETVNIPSTIKADNGKTYTVTEIEDTAFYRNWNLTTVTLPETITKIGKSAFYDTSIVSITIPEGITCIESGTFSSCSNLVTVNLPSTLKSIGSGAFYSCIDLKSIEIPDSVEIIEKYAFNDCTNLETFEFPKNIKEINGNIFCYNYFLTDVTIADGNKYYCQENGIIYNKEKTEVVLVSPDALKIIDENTFPDTVTKINRASFILIDYLKEANFSKNIKITESGAFAYTEIGTVTIPYTMVDVDTALVDPENVENLYCYHNTYAALKAREMNMSYKSLGNRGYKDEQGINYTLLDDNLALIFDYEYSNGKTVDIVIPDTIEVDGEEYTVFRINEDVFAEETTIESVYVSDSVTYIGQGAFYGLENLKKFRFPKELTEIPGYLLSYAKIEDLELPEGVKVIGEDAFEHLENLTEIYIPEGVQTIERGAFWSCYNLESIVLPKSLKKIDDSAFGYCYNLKNIDIPDGVTTIGCAFTYMGEVYVSIPESVTYIDPKAFEETKKAYIVGTIGSYAEAYAKFVGIDFIDSKDGKTVYEYSKNPIRFQVDIDDSLSNSTSGETDIKKDNESVTNAKIGAIKNLKVKSKGTKKVKIKWKKVKNASGYNILYARNKKFTKSKNTININKNVCKKIIKKLKKNKKYFFKVRAYKVVNGKKAYGDWSNIKRIKVK